MGHVPFSFGPCGERCRHLLIVDRDRPRTRRSGSYGRGEGARRDTAAKAARAGAGRGLRRRPGLKRAPARHPAHDRCGPPVACLDDLERTDPILTTGPLWARERPVNKIRSAFTTTGTAHGGQESAIPAINETSVTGARSSFRPATPNPFGSRRAAPTAPAASPRNGEIPPGPVEPAAMDFHPEGREPGYVSGPAAGTGTTLIPRSDEVPHPYSCRVGHFVGRGVRGLARLRRPPALRRRCPAGRDVPGRTR